MIKVFCDKCGKELNKAFMYAGSILRPEVTSWDAPFTEELESFDLCTDCAKKLEKFLKEDEE